MSFFLLWAYDCGWKLLGFKVTFWKLKDDGFLMEKLVRYRSYKCFKLEMKKSGWNGENNMHGIL